MFGHEGIVPYKSTAGRVKMSYDLFIAVPEDKVDVGVKIGDKIYHFSYESFGSMVLWHAEKFPGCEHKAVELEG